MNEPEHPDRDELPGDHHPAYQLWLERRRTLGEPLEGGLADRVIAALEGLEPTSTQPSPQSPEPTTGPAVAPRSVKGESVAWRWLRRAGQQAIVVAATLACLVRLCLILIPFTRLH
ncbi:MAG: hypothetical protein KDB14_04315 [Planctomycetales bacterium]|nr:hypothetical protein [Planctomycetales bacterium]